MPFASRLYVEPAADDTWRLLRPLTYRGSVDTWTIPAGYVTDFGSIPWLASWLVARYGRWTRATVVHDYLITHELPAGSIEPNDIDGVFRRILRELGVSTPRRWLMWAGVRWGALFGGRARRWRVTAAPVLAISIAALPAVAVGALGVLVGRLPLAVAELLSPMRDAQPDEIPTPRAGSGTSLIDVNALYAEAARRRAAAAGAVLVRAEFREVPAADRDDRAALDDMIERTLNGPQPIDAERVEDMIRRRVDLDRPDAEGGSDVHRTP